MGMDLVQNEERGGKGAKLEVIGSVQIRESREGLREKSLAMEIGEAWAMEINENRDGHGSSEALAMEIGDGSAPPLSVSL